MNLSLNEVEAASKRAARGAGYSWGLAEEAGKVSRWLCSNGLDGCGALATLLELVDGSQLSDWAPALDGDFWSAAGGTLCPLTTGAAVSDHSQNLLRGELRLSQIAVPLLLVPFSALLARQLGKPIAVQFCDGEFQTDGEQVSLTGTPPQLSSWAALSVCNAIGNPMGRQRRAFPEPHVWRILSRFAHRTYAPATEESRAKGAGSDLSDND